MKRVLVVFGAGAASGEISPISKRAIRSVGPLLNTQRFDVFVLAGSSGFGESESSLLKKYTEGLALPVPSLLEVEGWCLWEKTLNVIKALKKTFPDETCFITAIVLHSEMRRVLTMLKDAVAFFEEGHLISLYPAGEHYDPNAQKRKFRSARKLRFHENLSYLFYRLFPFLLPTQKSFCRALSAMRVRL